MLWSASLLISLARQMPRTLSSQVNVLAVVEAVGTTRLADFKELWETGDLPLAERVQNWEESLVLAATEALRTRGQAMDKNHEVLNQCLICATICRLRFCVVQSKHEMLTCKLERGAAFAARASRDTGRAALPAPSTVRRIHQRKILTGGWSAARQRSLGLRRIG